MIPDKTNRAVRSGGTTDAVQFGISMADEAHIMSILRDSMYSDRILAVLREYAANAWDAHRTSGQGDRPIKVVLPTREEATLSIRDYGPGMSHDEVFQVYTQYGASTKRSDDTAIGMLGIGSKSGFAYSDSFTVVSYHGGVKRVYIAVLDESDKGMLNFVHEEPTDETGIEIQIAVKPEDINEFHSKARKLYQFFEPRPDINTDMPPKPTDRLALPNGSIEAKKRSEHWYFNSEWVAVMGPIPYRVQIDQLPITELGKEIAKTIPNLSGTLYFEIGELQISASREDLKYSKTTKQALLDKIITVIDEFVVYTLKVIEEQSVSAWDKRVKLQALTHLHLPIPDLWAGFAEASCSLKHDAKEFTLVSNRSSVSYINVASDVRLLIDDTNLKLEGYSIQYNDYVVRPAEGKTVDSAIKALDEALIVSLMTGVTVKRLSELPWTKPDNGKPKRTPNPKHRVRTFRLIEHVGFHAPFSDHWAVEDREPTDADVYVVIDNFKSTDDYSAFFQHVREDFRLYAKLGVTMPEVYGYKTTEKKPVDRKALKGTHYEKWRVKFAAQQLTPARMAMIERLHLLCGPNGAYSSRWFNITDAAMADLLKNLGRRHPVVKFALETRAVYKQLKKLDRYEREAHVTLAGLAGCTFQKSAAHKDFEKLLSTYPLLKLFGTDGNHGIFSTRAAVRPWCEYIQLVDRDRGSPKTTGGQLISLPLNPSPTKDNESDDDSDDAAPVSAHA